jgi:hypothetical protein
LSNIRKDSGVKRVCYIDDDMYVNVEVLNAELNAVLADPPSTCTRPDRCVVADACQSWGKMKQIYKQLVYANTVMCMTIPTVEAVGALFEENNDEELHWSTTVSRLFFDVL